MNKNFKPIARVRVRIANRDSKVSLNLKRPLRAYLDTGASVSVLPPSALEALQRTGPLQKEDVQIQTMNGLKPATIIKNATLCVNSICFRGEVAIMDVTDGDLMLGSDFLSSAQCVIDFKKKRVKCKKGEFKFHMEH